MDDDDSIAPTAEAPPDSGIIGFSSEPVTNLDNFTPKLVYSADDVMPADEVGSSHLLLDESAIAEAIEKNCARTRYGAKVALEAMVDNGKLLKMLRDHHGYQGDRYADFAVTHGITNRRDAYKLYRLGEKGDEILAQLREAERNRSNFEWPHWQKVLRDLAREDRKAERRLNDKPEPEPKPDPLADLVRENDELRQQVEAQAQQVEALVQQLRDERSRREEAQEAYEQLVAQVAAEALAQRRFRIRRGFRELRRKELLPMGWIPIAKPVGEPPDADEPEIITDEEMRRAYVQMIESDEPEPEPAPRPAPRARRARARRGKTGGSEHGAETAH